jgi:hypothetical protein
LKPARENSLGDPSLKIPTQNRTGKVAQVVELLPNKCEVLNLNSRSSLQKKKKKKKLGTGDSCL